MAIDKYTRGIPTYKGKDGLTYGHLVETKESCITDDNGVSLSDKLANIVSGGGGASSEELENIINGTTTVGNANKLGNETAEAWQTKIDNIQTTSRATLSTAGWYRVAEYKPTINVESSLRGIASNSCTLILKRRYNSRNSEHHEIKLLSRFEVQRFVSVNSNALSGNKHITKVRYAYTTDTAYIEIYYDHSGSNGLLCEIADAIDMNGIWKAITPTLTSETVDGVTVTTTYDIPANASPVTETDGNITVDTGSEVKRATVTAKNNWGSVSLFTGTTGNHGVYSDTFEKWLLRIDKATGEVYIDPTALANYLPKSGGTVGKIKVEKAGDSPMEVSRTDANLSIIKFSGIDGALGYLGFNGVNNPEFRQTDGYSRTLLHTGNKPTGTYTGNGSATERTVNVGGIGNILALYCYNGGCVIVTPYGAFGKKADGATTVAFTATQLKFVNGTLSIATNDSTVNPNGINIGYAVL